MRNFEKYVGSMEGESFVIKVMMGMSREMWKCDVERGGVFIRCKCL